MKIRKIIPIVLLLFTISYSGYGLEIGDTQAIKASRNFIINHNQEHKIKEVKSISDNNIVLFHLIELAPQGYVIVSSNENLHPIIAYSFENNLDTNGPFFSLLKADIKIRISTLNKLPKNITSERNKAWENLLNGNNSQQKLFEQWPEEGSTSTGGWLETNWTQSAPYNQMCPIDPVSSARSLVGCPATAMAMILNFHENTNDIQFSDEDGYYHNYAGRNFHIDDDYETIGFPSFVDLNKYLDTLNMHWISDVELTDNDKAAISFACGLAATQVFTSEGSGTFEVAQALAAYQKFYCTTSIIYTESDTELFPVLINNIIDGYPAHLALVDEAWSTGHNVVVDGYNTDNYFHVNFGWGGSSNGWYLIPDEMPYSLTVVEGIVVNIFPHCGLGNAKIEQTNNFSFYPNPATDIINIEFHDYTPNSLQSVEVYNNLGQLIFSKSISKNLTISVDMIGETGIYHFHIIDNTGNSIHSKKIVINK